MTVSVLESSVLRYGNGSATVFPFPFSATEAASVKVALVNGQVITEVPSAQYTVSLSNVAPSGTVTFGVAPVNGAVLFIYRSTPQTQLVDVTSQARYDPAVVQRVWDKLTFIAQELQAKLDRALLVAPGTTSEDFLEDIALAEGYANSALASAQAAANYSPAYFDTLADMKASATVWPTGQILNTRSEGFSFKVQPVVFADPDHVLASGSKVTVEATDGELDFLAFDIDRTGVADASPGFTRIANRQMICEVPAGRYRLNTPVPLKNFTRFRGANGGDIATLGGSILLQYGTAAFVGDEDLRWADVVGFSLDYQGPATNSYTVAFALKAHRHCVFSDLRFVRYNDCTIMERLPQTATINSIDNEYKNWVVEACVHICLTIGQDGWGKSFQGNGSTTIFDTGVTWPELFNSSVGVWRENFGRNYTQLVLGTDYTLTFPSGVLRVTMVSPPAATDRIHVMPSQPLASNGHRQRRPFSNNRWTNIVCNYNFGHAWQTLRWSDAEVFDGFRFTGAADQVRCFVTNPGTDRTCEAGDFDSYKDGVISYLVGSCDPTTIWGFFMGPGSLQMFGSAIKMDLDWVHSGINRSLNNVDKRSVALTGTVAITSGSATVTGTGTAFTQQLTLIGDSKDKIEIGGVTYGIASINSATSLTLTSNAGVTLSGQAANRINAKNGNSGRFYWSNLGTSEYSNFRGGVGESVFGSSTEFSATVAVATNTTTLVIPHTLFRAPNLSADSISITPLSNVNIGGVDRAFWISNITTTSVQLNLSAAYASGPLNFKLVMALGPLN